MFKKNANVELKYELDNLHHVVVQASYVDKNANVYALQLLKGQTNTVVFSATKSTIGNHVIFDEDNPRLYLQGVSENGNAGSHTQTWISSGRENQFFVGTKPKRHGSINWDTQIARVTLSNQGIQTYDSNTDLVRLSYMNRAGYGHDNNSVVYPGKDLERLEAAISPDFSKFLVASIDLNNVGHFAVYDLNEINTALDAAEAQHEDVNIQNIKCLNAFMIPGLNSSILNSVQGYGIDNDLNVYISSEPSPGKNIFGMAKEGHPRQIVKIPWGESNPENWIQIDLNECLTLDVLGYVTEFEGIQIVGQDDILLTVAYHRKSDGTTLKNLIFSIRINS